MEGHQRWSRLCMSRRGRKPPPQAGMPTGPLLDRPWDACRLRPTVLSAVLLSCVRPLECSGHCGPRHSADLI